MTSPDFDVLRAYVNAEEQRKEKVKNSIIDHFKQRSFPTPDYVKEQMLGLVGAENSETMSHHPYWEEHKFRVGLKALFDTAFAAYVDMSKLEAYLSALWKDQSIFEKYVNHTVTNPFQKEVMAFCAASVGVTDTLRRFFSRRPEIKEQIEAAITGNLDNDLSAFIKGLRNNLAHGSVIVPGWKIASSVESGWSGTMILNVNELLFFGDWKAPAKRFIKSHQENQIHLGKVVELQYKSIYKLSSEVEGIFFDNQSPAEKDFYEIQDTQSRWGKQQFMKILLAQTSDATKPLQHARKYFDEKQMRKIMSYPPNSKEQVDYMILLKSSEIDCDEELKKLLYKLFKVNADL
jgi:hypothetical protein